MKDSALNEEIVLKITSNISGSSAKVSVLGGASDIYQTSSNARTQYAWDMTGATYDTDFVSVSYKRVGGNLWNTAVSGQSTAPITNITGLVTALNALNLGYFWKIGDVVYTTNDTFLFAALELTNVPASFNDVYEFAARYYLLADPDGLYTTAGDVLAWVNEYPIEAGFVAKYGAKNIIPLSVGITDLPNAYTASGVIRMVYDSAIPINLPMPTLYYMNSATSRWDAVSGVIVSAEILTITLPATSIYGAAFVYTSDSNFSNLNQLLVVGDGSNELPFQPFLRVVNGSCNDLKNINYEMDDSNTFGTDVNGFTRNIDLGGGGYLENYPNLENVSYVMGTTIDPAGEQMVASYPLGNLGTYDTHIITYSQTQATAQSGLTKQLSTGVLDLSAQNAHSISFFEFNGLHWAANPLAIDPSSITTAAVDFEATITGLKGFSFANNTFDTIDSSILAIGSNYAFSDALFLISTSYRNVAASATFPLGVLWNLTGITSVDLSDNNFTNFPFLVSVCFVDIGEVDTSGVWQSSLDVTGNALAVADVNRILESYHALWVTKGNPTANGTINLSGQTPAAAPTVAASVITDLTTARLHGID